MANRSGGKSPRPKRKGKSKGVAEPYEPTRQEVAAAEAFGQRAKAKALPPTLTVDVVGEDATIGIDHPNAETGATLLLNALGTTNTNFADGLLKQVSRIATDGHDVEVESINFMVAVIGDIEPRDQMEAMLAAQMAAVHMATMSFASRLTSADRLYQVDAVQKALNKLARTFAAQMEALNRYRGKGQQKMTVEHVHVHEGGQAIVGSVTKGGGG
jgi:hypothetical protein